MAIIRQTVVECDRCRTQFTDEESLHRFSLSEGGLCVGGISNSVLKQWVGDVGKIHLCQDCADDLRDMWVSFSEDSVPQ